MGFEPEGVRAAAAAATPVSLDDSPSVVAPFASLIMTYDGSNRVASVARVGSESSPVVSSMTYGIASSTPTGYDPAWHSRTIVHDPTSYTTYYFDNAGQALSVVTTAADPCGSGTIHKWVTPVERDSTGLITAIHTPANVTGYTHSDGTFTTSTTDGLVLVLDRVTGNG